MSKQLHSDAQLALVVLAGTEFESFVVRKHRKRLFQQRKSVRFVSSTFRVALSYLFKRKSPAKVLHLFLLWGKAAPSLLHGEAKGTSICSAFTLGQYILRTLRQK